ncbi:MAG TPA: imidazoleglycerol-phosphate dehydratase HisB [Dehalococcoidia bacterium]
MRSASVRRETKETRVAVDLNLDGSGQVRVSTGIGMLDHLLEQLGKHGSFDLTVEARGDLQVDEHHTVEDVALCVGRALDEALGDRRGIVRMGHAAVPLDEALALVAVDLSGRPYAVVEVPFTLERIGGLPSSLVRHALESLAAAGRMNLHARLLSGEDDHHKAEATFKALARALHAASRIDPQRAGEVPSTKGTL